MSQTIFAVYENGTLILDEPLPVANGAEVEVIVLPAKNRMREKTSAELLAEIAALPMEGTVEKFSNRDHDRILYGKEREK